MRFSVAAVFAAVAAGVVAEEVRTVIVTETATYCPKSTDAIGVSPTESISIPAGYTTTRPLITSTVTECNKWYVIYRRLPFCINHQAHTITAPAPPLLLALPLASTLLAALPPALPLFPSFQAFPASPAAPRLLLAAAPPSSSAPAAAASSSPPPLCPRPLWLTPPSLLPPTLLLLLLLPVLLMSPPPAPLPPPLSLSSLAVAPARLLAPVPVLRPSSVSLLFCCKLI
ncbi:hypothetical protein BDV24DRAFT_145512 [Aspergillus arachidicola]|uniref:Uncharacterized protein n=1 Tax=Aspergillus arachidicola TaxID=656916 RepID=A0A5N6XPP2_9EURO|nr:hypothetical protein BDV24DRAFT_145512 [Aspergillus arachidicola]